MGEIKRERQEREGRGKKQEEDARMNIFVCVNRRDSQEVVHGWPEPNSK
jgi:hypothetical protein